MKARPARRLRAKRLRYGAGDGTEPTDRRREDEPGKQARNGDRESKRRRTLRRSGQTVERRKEESAGWGKLDNKAGKPLGRKARRRPPKQSTARRRNKTKEKQATKRKQRARKRHRRRRSARGKKGSNRKQKKHKSVEARKTRARNKLAAGLRRRQRGERGRQQGKAATATPTAGCRGGKGVGGKKEKKPATASGRSDGGKASDHRVTEAESGEQQRREGGSTARE